MSAQELTTTPVAPKNELTFHNEEAHQTLINEVKKVTPEVIVPEDHDAPPQQGNQAELDNFLKNVLKSSATESLAIGDPIVDPDKINEEEPKLKKKPFMTSMMNAIKGFLPSIFEEIRVAWIRKTSRETTSNVPLKVLEQYAADHDQDEIFKNKKQEPAVPVPAPVAVREQPSSNVVPFPPQEQSQAQTAPPPPTQLAALN